MTNIDYKLAHKIATSWTNALWRECHEQFGEEGQVVFLSTICGAYACAMRRLGADAGSAALNSMLRETGLGDWRLIQEN